MTKQLWINLPAKDVKKSTEFYTKIGFQLNPHHPNNEVAASFFVGEQKVVLMIFDEPTFKSFTNTPLTDTKNSAEVLFSIDAESKEEVDELARKAAEAGGATTHQPTEQRGWMYGCLFTDPDGHRWNVLYMDMSKMPKP